MHSEESYRTKESYGPSPEGEELMKITDVLGIKEPEKPYDLGEEPVIGADSDDDGADPYGAWKAAPGKDTLNTVVNSLKPTISAVVASMGGSGDPRIAARARVVAAKAVQTYNPEYGTTLPTWVSQQLRQLTRDIRKSNSAVSVPDGVKLDAFAIYRAEAEFEDKHGYEPNLEELADVAKMPVKRIVDVRRKMKHISGEDTGAADADGVPPQMPGADSDHSEEAMDYIYPNLDRKDKLILEYTTGYGGRKPIGNKELMAKLKLTDVQLSRRKARVSVLLREALEGIEGVQ